MAEGAAPVDVRLLGPGDAATLRAMLGMFAAAFEDAETYGAAPPDDAYLADLLARDDFVAVAATVDGEVAGGLAGYILRKFEQARSEFHIYDLAVAERWRRRGIATALIERLRVVARERGAWVIYVQADHGDDPAVALYSKLGRREDVMHFDIEPAA